MAIGAPIKKRRMIMEGLIKSTSAVALCLLGSAAQAEFKPLDDSALSGVTGQAGVTVELQTQLDIDNVGYQDEGWLNINNIHVGGATPGTALDNVKVTLDIAGDGEVFAHGFSELATRGMADATTMADYDLGGGQYGRAYNSGDTIIRISPIDPHAYDSLSNFESAIDFGMDIGSINVSSQADGAAAATHTSVFSNISMKGYLGPTDIVVHNNGNGSHTLADGTQLGDSSIDIDTNFKITDMNLDWDAADVLLLLNFSAVGLRGMTITNTEGNDTAGHYGFASASAKIARATSTTGHEGMAVRDVNFRADINIPTVLVGGTSIGSVKFTDFVIDHTNLVIYGH